MMNSLGHITPEALELFYSAYAEKYDYATCERPDGSKYGTSGQCRKGKEVAPGSEDKPKPKPKSARKKAEEGVGAPVPPADAVKEMTDRMKEGREWTPDHEKVWGRILAATDTKALGSLTRKLNKEVFDENKLDVSAGFLKLGLTKMKDWLQANGRSGVGAKREAERANMTPEELRRANTADRIQRGIRGGVVNPRMR